jgi:hypothetical protein
MKLLELKTLICAECGIVCRPQQAPLRGVIVIDGQEVLYYHPANIDCPHEHEVYKVWVWPANLPDGVLVGKEDWSRIPEKLVAGRREVSGEKGNE